MVHHRFESAERLRKLSDFASGETSGEEVPPPCRRAMRYGYRPRTLTLSVFE